MTNGNDLIEYEEKNYSRLRAEFLKTSLDTESYWKFVLEDMNGK